MRRASSIKQIPLSESNSSSALSTRTSAPGSTSPGSDAPVPQESACFAIAELLERRLRFGNPVAELASFPEEISLRGFQLYFLNQRQWLCLVPLFASCFFEDNLYDVSSSEDVCCPHVSWGGAAAQGQRPAMEDAHIGIQDLESFTGRDYQTPHTRSFFGVFDGHGGPSAAEFARDNLLHLIVSNKCFSNRPGEALNSAFLDLDELFYSAVQASREQVSGSTLLAALLWGSQLLVANAGDSRAVLCRRGRAMALSRDHKPTMLSETNRIVTSGGYVCKEGFLNGQLGVSRAIGDYHLKGLKRKPSADEPLYGPLTAEPEISVYSLMTEDEFIVLACDGLWDVMQSQRAVEMARQCLQQNNNNPQICAQMLVDKALERHASDNVTVLVICLSSSIPPKREYGNKDKVRRNFSQNGLDMIKSALQDL